MDFPELTITFLGTGTSTGIPMIACPCRVCHSENEKDKRLRSSIRIESAGTTLVVDTTPDFRQQMLRLENTKLDAILYTHPHKDHTGGLDDVRAYNFFQRKPMDLYANALTTEALRRDYAYAFSDHRYPGIPELNMITIDESPFVVGNIPVIPIRVWHHKMPVYAYRFGNFTYITDANRIEDSEMEKIKGSEIIVINALREEDHISHFTLKQAVELVEQLKIPRAYFTHISHQLGKHDEVNKKLPAHISLAYDGLQISL
ncbi:MAG: MBL fold metallo-hydrolase [Chitinophagaceae bacterium]